MMRGNPGRPVTSPYGIDNGWSASLGAFDIAGVGPYGCRPERKHTVYALRTWINDAFSSRVGTAAEPIRSWLVLQCTDRLTAADARYAHGRKRCSALSKTCDPLRAWLRSRGVHHRRRVIENARGGSGNDVSSATVHNNVLTGKCGNDTLDGPQGNDV